MHSFTALANMYASTYKRPVARAPATVNRKTEYGFLQKTLDAYRDAMNGRGWMTTEQVAGKASTDKWAAKDVLKRLFKAGLVELDDSGKNAKGRTMYRWKWKE